MKVLFEDEKKNIVQMETGNTHLRIQKNDEPAYEEKFGKRPAMIAFFSAEIEALTKNGFTQRLLLEERISTPAVSTDYFENIFFDELKSSFGVDAGESEGLLNYLEKERGIVLPPNLRTFITFRDTHPFDAFTFGDISFSKNDCSPSNFEDSILDVQKGFESNEMIKNFVGAIELGQEDGDTFFAVPHEYDPQRAEVWIFSKEDGSPSHSIAADIPTFFYAHHLLASSRSGGDQGEIASQFKPVQNRVDCEKLSEEIGIPSTYISDSKENVLYLFDRSYWISFLFSQNESFDLEDIAATFHAEVHTPQVWEKVRQFRFIAQTPTTQLYWLWRLFWFNRPLDLAECIEICKASPSKYVLSAIELIEEFESGRKEIGKIDDIHALRDQWNELGLDPARSEQNLEAQADAAEKIERDLANAHEAIRTLSDKELFKKAWSYTEQRNVIEVWLEHLRHSEEIPTESLDRLESQVR